MSFETAQDYWGSKVGSYDSLIRRIVPRYDEITAQLIEHLPASAARVIELGCGTGNLSLALAARFQGAEITFVDASPEMLAVTRERLEAKWPAVAKRAAFREARFEDLAIPASSIDAVASQMSVHHVKDKTALFARLHGMLAPGGAVVFADRMRSATEEAHAANWGRWVELCKKNCSASEVDGLMEHAAKHDHYATLGEHLAALESAGFRGVDCVWRDWAWGVITAVK